jgi:hypothetical protein
MVLEFGRKGYTPTILKTDLHKHPKAHVTPFEPAEHKKLDDLEMIVECLQHYKRPMSSLQLSEETNIPRSTVTFRIWENCEGRLGFKRRQKKDPHLSPLFYTDAKKGFRGTELIGLVKS